MWLSSGSRRMPTSSVDSTGCRNCRLPLDFSEKTVNVFGPIVPVINPGADSWVEGWRPDGPPSLPGISSPVNTEEPVISEKDMAAVKLDIPEQERYYHEHFLSTSHVNYCAIDNALGPIVMSLKYDESDAPTFRVLIRTREATVCRSFSAKMVSEEPRVEEIATVVLPDLSPSVRFQSTLAPSVHSLILDYDEHAKQTRYKFGILTQAKGQDTEEAIFSNNTISPSLSKFLDTVGTEVDLQGFEGFRGGLDVKGNLSGKKSYFAKFKNREIMFHVSPLMPFSKTDHQQVARKRHIGNDIVCVVFQEESCTTFDPHWIASSFLHTYIVVQPVTGEDAAQQSSGSPIMEQSTIHSNTNDSDDTTYYRISVCSKKSVPPFHPLLPSTGVFPVTKDFRHFFLSLLINAERSSTKAEQFAKLERRTREFLLRDLHQSVVNACDTSDTSSISSSSNRDGKKSGLRKLIPSSTKKRSSSSAAAPATPVAMPSTPSMASLTSQMSTTSASPLEGKGLLNFFRANTTHKTSRARASTEKLQTLKQDDSMSLSSTSSRTSGRRDIISPQSKARAQLSGLPATFIEADITLLRSSSVISETTMAALGSIRNKVASGELGSSSVGVAMGDVFVSGISPADLNGSLDSTLVLSNERVDTLSTLSIESVENGAGMDKETLATAVTLLHATVASFKEERLQLLREDVAMRAKIAEYEARELARERELLEARSEAAQLRGQLALMALHADQQFTDGSGAKANNMGLQGEPFMDGMAV